MPELTIYYWQLSPVAKYPSYNSLIDASFGPNIRIWQLANEKVANLGQCYACINPEFFAPGFQDRMSNLMDFLRAMEPVSSNP